MLLLKNPQFLSNHYENLSKCGINEYLSLTKIRNDWVKIVDFLIIAYFFMCTIFLHQTLCMNDVRIANASAYRHTLP